MRPSSTFSFDTLQLAGFRPWAAIMTLVMLLGVELGISRQAWVWTHILNSPTGLVAVQDDLIIPNFERPTIVVMGNSRMIDAVSPQMLESNLSLPPESVMNLSLQAGRPFDFLSCYQRNRERLNRSGLLIVGLDDWMFSDQMDTAEQRFRYLATLKQRWEYQGKKRRSFVAGWYVRTMDAGGPMLRTIRSLLRRQEPVLLGDDCRLVFHEQVEHGPEEVPLETLEELVYKYYGKFAPNASQVAYLNELVELARADGVGVMFVRPPLRDQFVDLVTQQQAAQLGQARALQEGLVEVPLAWYDRASELNMPETAFRDYGHMASDGARMFATILSEQIEQCFPEVVATGRSTTRE